MGLVDWALVPTDRIPIVWPAVSRILAKAVERDDGRRTLESIRKELDADQNQLWVVFDREPIGVVITSLLLYPNQKACKVEWLAGARLNEWVHLISRIEDWAKAQGCYGVEIAGRPGLSRVMKQYGYEVTGFEARKLI